MTRKTVAELLAFAELCVQEKWQTGQADRVREIALQLAKARDRRMLDKMRNRLGVRE